MQDPFLGALIRGLDNQPDGIITLTLWVGSSIITGTAIPRDEYYQRFAAGIRIASERLMSEEDGAINANEMMEIGSKLSMDNDERRDQPDAIHLKEPQLVTLGNPLNKTVLKGVVLRVRLDSVDAFMLGSLG